jgi:hypothetical protein
MIITNREHWSTGNELKYVDALASGAWRKWCESPIDITPEVLLSNYIRGAEHRAAHKTFGSVEPDKVLACARGHLERVRG